MSSCDDSPLQSKDVFFRSRFVEWSSRCSRRTNSRRNWQSNTCKRLFEKKNEKWLWKCILPVFCCFHPNDERTSGFLRCLHVYFWTLLKLQLPISSPSHGVGRKIVLFRRNVELASCRWMLLTFRRSPATFKCTFSTRRPKRNFIISLNGLQWTPREFICGRPKKTFLRS